MPWATENVHIEKQQLLSAAKRLNDQGELDSVGQNVFDSLVRSAEANSAHREFQYQIVGRMSSLVENTSRTADEDRELKLLAEVASDVLGENVPTDKGGFTLWMKREQPTRTFWMHEGRAAQTDMAFRDTRTGATIPVLARDDRFADIVAGTNHGKLIPSDLDSEYDGLSVGRMMRALVTGANIGAERFALSEGIDTAGGYTVPDILSAQLIDRLRTKARVFEAGARTVELQGERHSFAKLTADPTPVWRSEKLEVDEDEPTFGLLTFTPKTLAVLVKVSEELLQDSVNVEEALETSLAAALANEVDRVALLGDADSQEPVGISFMENVNEVSMGTNGAALSDYSKILDGIKLMQDDNAGETSAAIMAPRTWRTFAGFVDSTGQPLRRPQAIENLRFLETSQVPIDQTPGTANEASTSYLGDLPTLGVGFRSRLKIEVLRERYRENLQVGFLAHLRADIAAFHEEALARIVGITP